MVFRVKIIDPNDNYERELICELDDKSYEDLVYNMNTVYHINTGLNYISGMEEHCKSIINRILRQMRAI